MPIVLFFGTTSVVPNSTWDSRQVTNHYMHRRTITVRITAL